MTFQELFSIDTVLLEIWGYSLSPLEAVGTVAGLLCIWFASRNNIKTWYFGLVNVSLFFLLFYQVRLYSDMFLQIYFFGINLYGLVRWTRRGSNGAQLAVSWMSGRSRLWFGVAAVAGISLMGYCMSNLNLWFPGAFPEPAAFPYADSVIAVLSIIANYLMAVRKVENWVLWVAVNVFAVVLYISKGIYFVAAEYVINFGIALSGLITWIKLAKK